MKKLYSILLFSFLFLTFVQATYVEQLPENDMYMFIYHQEALTELKQSCGDIINTTTQATADGVTQSILSKMNGMSSVEQFLFAHNLYKKISSIYPLVFNMGADKKCYYGSIFISLQESLRNHNINIMDQYNILSDFANVEEKDEDEDKSKSDQFRQQFITHFNNKYLNQANKLPTQKRITSTALPSNLGAESQLASALVQLTTHMTYGTINDLYNKKYISKTEAEDLLSKITINYNPSTCSSYHGKFSVKHTIKNGEKHDTNISGIDLNINGCYNIFVLSELEEIMQVLILHEIGGHLGHYIKDSQRETFQAICRESKEVRNDKCSANDFVSPYAFTNSYEDYAETFTYRRLDMVPHKSNIINQKINYMNNMYKRIKAGK